MVDVFGSSYRRPGARMLITDDGQLTGAISGGCLEGDALKKALHVIDNKRHQYKPMIRWMMMMPLLVLVWGVME